jgi:predicted small lipoprotein YifL
MTPRPSTLLVALAALAGLGALTGCGQKGPLVLLPPAEAASAPAR